MRAHGAKPSSPWTLAADLAYADETRAFAEYILHEVPNAEIAVLYQNDDFGKDHLNGLKAALGDKANRMILKAESFEVTDPTIDSQIVTLQSTGADVLVTAGIPKFTAQMIRKVGDIGWKPLTFIAFPSSSIPLVLKPAGLEKSVGLITAAFVKFPGDPDDFLAIAGYCGAAEAAFVLRQCGDNLTRENVLYQAMHMKGVRIPMLLPGITVTTGPDDYRPVKEMQFQRFDGTRWAPLGGLVGK